MYAENVLVREHVDEALNRLNGLTADSIDELDALIQQQAYRIAFWKVATERINYRRFFDVSDLIGMRVEQPRGVRSKPQTDI